MNDVLLSPIRLNELETLVQHSVERAIKAVFQSKNDIPDLLVNTDQSVKRRKLNSQKSADYYGISLPTFYSKVSKGEIPVYKVPGGKHLFCFEDELEELLKTGKQKTNTEIEAEAENYLIKKKGLKNG